MHFSVFTGLIASLRVLSQTSVFHLDHKSDSGCPGGVDTHNEKRGGVFPKVSEPWGFSYYLGVSKALRVESGCAIAGAKSGANCSGPGIGGKCYDLGLRPVTKEEYACETDASGTR